jgi:hypothetical protein
MKMIFSPHLLPLPIAIDYRHPYAKTAKDLRRVRAALECCDRVRGITFVGPSCDFEEILKATHRPFPLLESLEFRLRENGEITLPATFLSGSVPKLRCLHLRCIFPASLSSLLSTSATTLVDLYLGIDTIFGPSQAASLFACLQAMRCLCRLELEMQTLPRSMISINDPTYLSYLTNPARIVPLLNLTRFHFYGRSAFLNAFAAGFAAPSLQDVNIGLGDDTPFPIWHLTRFIGDVKKLLCRSAQVIFKRESFRVSLLTCSEHIHFEDPRFRFYTKRSPESLIRTCSILSAELANVEELLLSFNTDGAVSRRPIPWRQFLRLFCGVKVLRLERGNADILDLAYSLQPNDEGPVLDVLPLLEEIELRADKSTSKSELASGLAAFQPFVSARQQASRPVRVLWGAIASYVWWTFPGWFH